MLDIKKILSRSWHILWNYRMLWVFGFILALTVAGASGSNGGSNSSNRNNGDNRFNIQPGQEWQGLKGETPREKMSDAFRQAGEAIAKVRAQYPVESRMVIGLIITFIVMVVIFSIIGAFLRYTAEAATIRMVNEYEQSNIKVGFRQGWKYGWSSAAWRLFLINFLINLPGLVLLGILVLIGWWIATAALSGIQATLITSLIAGIGLAFIAILVTIVVMVVLYLVRDFAWRFSVLENFGVFEALSQSVALIRRNVKNVGLMWLVMIGIKIAWGVAFLILIIPLLIVSVITGIGGLLVAIVPGLLTAMVASLLSAPDYWPWIFAALISLPLFASVTFSPVLLVRGWSLTYESSVWTLTYREIKTLETVAPAAPIVPAAESTNS